MPTLQATEALPYRNAAHPAVTEVSPITSRRQETRLSSLIIPTATTSLAAHLLLIAWFGSGISQPAARVAKEPEPIVAPVEVETVLVQQEPEALTPEPAETPDPVLDAPAPAAAVDIPALPEVQAISAVPASVAVSFGVEVKGPVRVISDAAHASSGSANARRAQPIALDAASEHNLLLPAITYPARAKRQRLTGTVLIEFRTSPTGEIVDVRVRESSGHSLLDDAAKSNLLAGRWKGRPGAYIKAYEFSLQ